MRLQLIATFAAFTLTAALTAGCGATRPSAPSSTASHPTASPLKPAGQAKIGDRTRCIVSGDEFTITAAMPHVEYKGKTYYFCCPTCPKDFLKDPEKYLGKAGVSA